MPDCTGLAKVFAFPSALGWIAIAGTGGTLRQLSFGHPSEEAAWAGLDPLLAATAEHEDWNPALARRLQAYAAGAADDFRDVEIDVQAHTPFQRRVLRACRRIALGSTRSYGELAAEAGAPGAARAVGNCMAHNRVPLVVPCHRVIGAGGKLHGFSASGGISMKRRLLELEAEMVEGRADMGRRSPAHAGK